MPFEQVVAYIGGCDLGVISVEPITLSYRYCMPNKLFELALANVPIVSNKLDEIAEFIGEFGNGEVVDFASSAALAYTMFRMLEEKPRYVMGPQAQERLHARYSWAAQSAKLLAIYEAILVDRVGSARAPTRAERGALVPPTSSDHAVKSSSVDSTVPASIDASPAR